MFILIVFYYAGHVKLISLGAPLFSEGKWRISRSVVEGSGLRPGSKGGYTEKEKNKEEEVEEE